MFRVIIWGQSFIMLGIALLAYVLVQDSEKFKKSLPVKLIVWLLFGLSGVTFLLSFDIIRHFFARLFL